MTLNEGMFSSATVHWCSPEVVLAPVRELAGGVIGLDPCGNERSIVRAAREYRLSRGEDGLRLPWDGFGLVYGNFPYGDDIGAFMRRAATYGARGVEIVALIPNRTDTEWYQENVADVAAKCEWYGRLVHHRGVAESAQGSLFAAEASVELDESGTAPFPSALLYWGHQARRFEQLFAPNGRVWR
jgi:hypothetical protein